MKPLLVSVVLFLGVIVSSVSAASAAAPAFEWIPLQTPAPAANAVNIIIAGDGYTAAQRALFVADAGKVINSLAVVEPWKTYLAHINFYAAYAVSNEAGASLWSGGKITKPLDTAFKGTIDIDRATGGLLIDSNIQQAFEAATPVSGTYLYLVNDTTQGFRGDGSFGSAYVTRNDDIGEFSNFVLHELGHAFGNLDDEYLGDGAGKGAGKNTTTDLNAIPWKKWIEAGTPIPTPDSLAIGTSNPDDAVNKVGAFEGAYKATAYRATWTSIMSGGGVDYGPVNTEALVLSIYTTTSPVNATSPASKTITLAPGQEQVFTVQKYSTPATITASWFLNDVAYTQVVGDSVTLRAADLANGQYTLKCIVKDTTTLVRNDPSNLTQDTVTWTIQVGTPPQITTQPTNVSVSAGSPASLSIVATGPQLTYQWRLSGQAIAGATASTYSITSAATSNAGQYDCIVSNLSGSVTSTAASLTVTPVVTPPSSSSGSGGGGGGGAPSDWFLASLAILTALRGLRNGVRK